MTVKTFCTLVGSCVLVAGLLLVRELPTVVSADTATTTVTVTNATPVVSAVSLNSGSNITLTENTSVAVTGTMTVTDANGCSELTGTTATLHRSGVNSSCSQNDNNCYTAVCTQVGSGNTCTGGLDTSVDYQCSFTVWYIADPTDAGSVNAGEIWTLSATSTDGVASGTATNTGETVDILTLLALNVTSSIAYGSHSPSTDTGATNQTAAVTNTGNAAQDDELSGDAMCTDYPTCSGSTLAVNNQKYSLADVTYASLTGTLSGTPTSVQTNLAKPTATTTPQTVNTFWGIAIPSGQNTGSYTGKNTFTAIVNS